MEDRRSQQREAANGAEPQGEETRAPEDRTDTPDAAGAVMADPPEADGPPTETQSLPETQAEPDPEAPLDPDTPQELEPVHDPQAAREEPEADPWTPCDAGLFGKLPARGDFISRAIAQDLLRPLEDWLLPLVQNTRALLDGEWSRAWSQAPPWRFWIGPDILRGEWTRNLRAHEQAGTVTGVLLPSADRQGRLFPLVLVLADDHARLMPPPVISPPDRRWYAACDRLLLDARGGATLEQVEADLTRLRAPRLPEGAEQMAGLLTQRSLWGQGAGRQDADEDGDVWSGIRASDHHLAATGRSYWWCEGAEGTTSVISLSGLPNAETFAFMLTDAIPTETPQTGA